MPNDAIDVMEKALFMAAITLMHERGKAAGKKVACIEVFVRIFDEALVEIDQAFYSLRIDAGPTNPDKAVDPTVREKE